MAVGCRQGAGSLASVCGTDVCPACLSQQDLELPEEPVPLSCRRDSLPTAQLLARLEPPDGATTDWCTTNIGRPTPVGLGPPAGSVLCLGEGRG